MASILPVREMIPFVPAKDYEASKRFYGELFEIEWEAERLCRVQAGTSKFLPQNHQPAGITQTTPVDCEVCRAAGSMLIYSYQSVYLWSMRDASLEMG